MTLMRGFLALQTAVFVSAALMHTGVLVHGYEHSAARTAESIIALVLLIGLAGTAVAPGFGRRIALGVQGFALLGTAVGLFTIVIGVGPRTDAARRDDGPPRHRARCGQTTATSVGEPRERWLT